MISLFAAIALAQVSPAQTSMITLGAGGHSCRSWTLNRQRGGAGRSADREWIAGFLTGMEFSNSGLGAQPLLRDSDDPETLIGIVDDYCVKHPVENVAEAAQTLWLSLFRRSQH